MRELSLVELKQIEIELLKKIDEFCNENGIKYYAHAGTLLGAIRHKGFIPWDDDIDISMSREDYEKFIKLTNKDDCPFGFECFENNNSYVYAFGKAFDKNTILIEHERPMEDLGVYIDVFPLDSLPNNLKLAKNYVKKSRILVLCQLLASETKFKKLKTKKATMVKRLIKPFVKIFGCKFWTNKLIKKSKKYNGLQTKYISNIVSPHYVHVYEKEWFDEVVRLPFENIEINVPAGYKELLTTMYGDYMKLPPEEKRKSSHNFIAYRK